MHGEKVVTHIVHIKFLCSMEMKENVDDFFFDNHSLLRFCEENLTLHSYSLVTRDGKKKLKTYRYRELLLNFVQYTKTDKI